MDGIRARRLRWDAGGCPGTSSVFFVGFPLSANSDVAPVTDYQTSLAIGQ